MISVESCDIMLFVIKKSLRDYIEYALLAQLVEHLTLNQGVQGSSPWRRSIKYRFCGHRSHGVGAFFCFTGGQIHGTLIVVRKIGRRDRDEAYQFN